ncbi:MAG: DEAD/DEAH box helicase [Candidatus Omnitrophica bacterium]|nr:DEAD/DEAH box helicase [Candidatus Omnitrophota bacterium]MDD5430181.1 DEAD/DEAH box helicase [Candidatus Omnitrophota bacterium]
MKPIVLDPFQKQAISCAKENHSIIVSAPTGAGKTLIAEHIIEDCINKDKGVIYTAPIKALSNQKFRDFSLKYPGKTGILTGDVSINRNAPILIMTTEIFRNAILVNPEEFKKRDWVIFDEIHYLDDIERGTVWEEAIILLPKEMKLLALSATIPNIGDFSKWLREVHSFPVDSIVEKIRPVPLHFLFQCDNEVFDNFPALKNSKFLRRNLKNPSYQERYFFSKPNRIRNLFQAIENRSGFPCVYFSFSRRRCEELAQESGQISLLSKSEKKEIVSLFDDLLTKFNLSASPHISFLSPLIAKGIAYHHAGLLPTLKEIIERLFTTGLIKLIFTTETFALGINMPAKTVAFDSLSKFYGRYHGYLKTRDFYQMAGRAGRRGIDTEGFVFSRINPSHIDHESLENIIYGDYEPIKSQLNSCYATILNLYQIMGEKIYDFYPKSFHFYQSKNWEKKDVLGLLKRKMALLKEMNYIRGGQITAKAFLAAKVYSFELAIGELFQIGALNGLNEEALFVLVTALVYEPRKGEQRPKFNKKIKKFKKDLNELTRYIHKTEKSFRIIPLSKNFFFNLSELSKMWYEGMDFSKLNRHCQIDEGEIVRYFRMGIQVLKEIRSSGIIDAPLKEKINRCIKAVNRDEIDAEKQLRQEI